jgi:hypothetical protein
MPRRNYVDDETGQLARIREVVRKLPAPSHATPHEEANVGSAPSDLPSKVFATFKGRSFSLRYPDNWQVRRGEQAEAVTIGPRGGVLPDAVGYGMQANYFSGDWEALIRSLEQANAEMRPAREARSIEVAGQAGWLNTLDSKSPYGGREVDVLVTVERPQGLFYIVFIAPKPEFEKAQPVFEDVLRSVRFR